MDAQDYRCPECITGLLEYTEEIQGFQCGECEADFSADEVEEEGLCEDSAESFEINMGPSEENDNEPFLELSEHHAFLVEEAKESGDWSAVEEFLDANPDYRDWHLNEG